MESKTNQTFFVAHEKEIMALFNEINEGVKQYLPSICDKTVAEAICSEAEGELEKLIPQLPDIGDKSLELDNGVSSVAVGIAYYKSFKRRGISIELLGKMLYDLRTFQLNEMTEEQRKAIADEMFSTKRLSEFKEWATWSQKCLYPYNWMAYYIEGDGEEFDYGADYVECGVAKICHKFKADELVPFICLLDLLESRSLGLGLVRTKTLAMGDNVCDFRFKRGRPTTQGWDTEIDKIRKLISLPSYEPVLKGHL
ncbi:MAG: L-2-amino-thiazoline-4-carboxylic acid hydrolase [Candidatus Eremiobacteraeota bacterium]|nr:L-2-amino-thiazoline-4-carboxylic acid hydrolase [Candidatus Eremiobacteraeota bacterium]